MPVFQSLTLIESKLFSYFPLTIQADDPVFVAMDEFTSLETWLASSGCPVSILTPKLQTVPELNHSCLPLS